ncbi:hypothetical protein ACIQ8D_08970 [Streptomyces sp. NPDC096094]|uniref:hypothetical protein n=1 Tax=Streptomyces sp. NPDC096094 TaxID=3366073 RepID=UPI00380C2979
MISETALLESPALRSSVLERTDVLDRVKALSLLPDGMHVTTAMVATYFEVSRKAIESLVFDHRDELTVSGYRVLAGTELTSFKEVSGIQSRSRSLALYPRRTVLNIAMLLRDSEVARQVRVSPGHGVSGPQAACGKPGPDRPGRPRRPHRPAHHPHPRQDRCTDVQRPDRNVERSPTSQKFVGAARILHSSEVALYVATCPCTRDARNIAAESGITAVHRGLLEEWSAGAPLTVLQ